MTFIDRRNNIDTMPWRFNVDAKQQQQQQQTKTTKTNKKKRKKF